MKSKTRKVIRKFIHKEILCYWGVISEIVINNGTTFVAAMEYLMKTYRIYHIYILVYNSQANRIIEHRHLDIQKALLKTYKGEVAK